MHYIDKAIKLKNKLDEKGITAYEYARICNVHQSVFSNVVRYLRLGDNVIKHIRKSTLGVSKAGQLLRIKGVKDDEYLIKIIKLDKIKKFKYERFKQLIDNELKRANVRR